MDVRCYGYLQIPSNGRKNLATFAHSNSSKGTDRSSICLVVRSLENEIDILVRADFRNLPRHPPTEPLGLDYAWTENKDRSSPANRHFANLEVLGFHQTLILATSVTQVNRPSSANVPDQRGDYVAQGRLWQT